MLMNNDQVVFPNSHSKWLGTYLYCIEIATNMMKLALTWPSSKTYVFSWCSLSIWVHKLSLVFHLMMILLDIALSIRALKLLWRFIILLRVRYCGCCTMPSCCTMSSCWHPGSAHPKADAAGLLRDTSDPLQQQPTVQRKVHIVSWWSNLHPPAASKQSWC